MKIIALNGSPRRNRSVTMLMLEPFLHGLHDAGASVELLHLADLNVKACRGCLECWFATPGQCSLRDDMADVLAKLEEADIWVFSTGVFWGGPSGLLKTAMDRMMPFLEYPMETVRGRTRNRLRGGVKKGRFVLAASCGSWEMESFEPLLAQTKEFCERIGRDFTGAMLRPHAYALPHMMWLAKETQPVLDAAYQLGKGLAADGKLDERLLRVAGGELMPQVAYVRHMNQETKKGAAEPRRTEESSLTTQRKGHALSLKTCRDPELGAAIVDAVNRMGGVGPDAERRYQTSLARLRERAKEVIPVLTTECKAQPEEHYLHRWALVHLLSELAHDDAVQPLQELIEAPLPEERSKYLHGYSTRAKELMIRTTAVEALARIAAGGNEEAKKNLLALVKHEWFSVRRAAVQAYLELEGERGLAVLRETLPRDQQHLLDIKRKDVREIPQAKRFDATSPREKMFRTPSLSGAGEPVKELAREDGPTACRSSEIDEA